MTQPTHTITNLANPGPDDSASSYAHIHSSAITVDATVDAASTIIGTAINGPTRIAGNTVVAYTTIGGHNTVHNTHTRHSVITANTTITDTALDTVIVAADATITGSTLTRTHITAANTTIADSDLYDTHITFPVAIHAAVLRHAHITSPGDYRTHTVDETTAAVYRAAHGWHWSLHVGNQPPYRSYGTGHLGHPPNPDTDRYNQPAHSAHEAFAFLHAAATHHHYTTTRILTELAKHPEFQAPTPTCGVGDTPATITPTPTSPTDPAKDHP